MEAQVPAPAIDTGAVVAALRPRAEGSLHQRLEGALRELITSGRVQPGSGIPGELELAAELRVSRHTIRHALGVLVNEGLLRRERGRGTTVVANAPPRLIERSLASFYAFAWEARASGVEQRSYVLERTPLLADAALAERLGLAAGASVERIVRVRTANREPLVLETTHLPERFARSLDTTSLEHEAIYDALERLHGLRVMRAHETIRPIVLKRSVARLLEAPSGSPAFSVERTTWSEHEPIEWQVSVVRGDRFLYSVDLPRHA